MCAFSLFMPAWLPRQQQFGDGACMKRRCVPLRADHNLLTPDTHTLSGVRLHPVVQVRSEVAASLSGRLCDSSCSKSTAGTTRRRPPTASPTRRLRFEDETETEAESRYLERQRRRAGQRATGVLVSKPDLNLYVNGRAGTGSQGVRHAVDRQQKGHTPARAADQCDSCGIIRGGGVNLNLHPHPPVPEDRGRSHYRPHVNLRTEPIRETYIGCVTPGETGGRAGGEQRATNVQVRRASNQGKLNGKQTTPNTDLPINPYASSQPTTATQPSYSPPHASKCPSSPPPLPSLMISQNVNGTKATKNQQDSGGPAADKPHTELRSGSELKERSPSVEEGGLDVKTSWTSDTKVEKKAQPTPGSSKQPMRAELPSDDTSLTEQSIRRDESSRLSLRRLFSNVRLSRTRSGSLDRLSSLPHSSAPDPATSPHRKCSGLLRKTLSVQSLSVGSPFMHLRKSSSAQNFPSDQKKKKDRSADYRPAAEQLLQRCLSLEDVSCPSSVRSVGRVLQVCPDGTFLLEVSRPKSQMYGFIISRGRGRTDSGVYVEDMVDSSTEKLYAGLLAVGDEILEVNGEKVACLSLDQVTHLLTQNTSATIRVLRQRRTSQR